MDVTSYMIIPFVLFLPEFKDVSLCFQGTYQPGIVKSGVLEIPVVFTSCFQKKLAAETEA